MGSTGNDQIGGVAMSASFTLTYAPDALEIRDEVKGTDLRVEKRGASEALGQLFSRRFVVHGEDGERLFQVIDGNSGTLPRASLKFDRSEALVLTAGGGHFSVNCLIDEGRFTFGGDPFSTSFSVVIDSKTTAEVSARRGGGRTVYRFDVLDDSRVVQTLAIVTTLAVFRGRIIPSIEPDPEQS